MTLRTDNPLAYVSWQHMKRRCDNSEIEEWPAYGGRGIRYVTRWRLFANFIDDMGERPSRDYSLERLNVNWHYGPRNCIWLPKSEQALNRRKAYNPLYGWQRGTLDDLFPPLADDLRPFMVGDRRTLKLSTDFLKQGPKWVARTR